MTKGVPCLTAALALVCVASLPSNAIASDDGWSILDNGVPSDGIQLAGPGLIYDPVGDRIVLAGGGEMDLYLDLLPSSRVSSWDMSNNDGWRRLTDSDGFGAHCTATYDPGNHRMWCLGGKDTDVWSVVWSMDLGSDLWSPIAPLGAPPTVQHSHSTIYDPVRNRLIVFGGDQVSYPPTGSPQNSVWQLSLSGTPRWIRLDPVGTPPVERRGHVAVYDAALDRMLVFGGETIGGAKLNDVWSLSFDGPVWTELSPSGVPPSARAYAGGVYDPEHLRLVLFGGNDATGSSDETWQLDLTGEGEWSQLPVSGPSARHGFGVAHDVAGQRMVVTCGIERQFSTWSLSLGETPEWRMIHPGYPSRVPEEHTAVLDTPRDRMIVFGSFPGGVAQTWAYSLGRERWSILETPSTLTPRGGHTAIYDPGRERMIVFGGFTQGAATNEVWSLDFSGTPGWTLLAASGMPPAPRFDHTAIYDPEADRMVVFGGRNGTNTNDMFRVRVTPNPAARRFSAAFELTNSGRAVVELLDPMGRRIEVRNVDAATPGSHSVSLGGERNLKPGIYWVRVTHEGRSAASRVAVID